MSKNVTFFKIELGSQATQIHERTSRRGKAYRRPGCPGIPPGAIRGGATLCPGATCVRSPSLSASVRFCPLLSLSVRFCPGNPGEERTHRTASVVQVQVWTAVTRNAPVDCRGSVRGMTRPQAAKAFMTKPTHPHGPGLQVLVTTPAPGS
jgi:hypothetical protein